VHLDLLDILRDCGFLLHFILLLLGLKFILQHLLVLAEPTFRVEFDLRGDILEHFDVGLEGLDGRFHHVA